MTEKAKESAAKTEEVTLKRAHMHRGELKQPDEKITLRTSQARRLKARGVAV